MLYRFACDKHTFSCLAQVGGTPWCITQYLFRVLTISCFGFDVRSMIGVHRKRRIVLDMIY